MYIIAVNMEYGKIKFVIWALNDGSAEGGYSGAADILELNAMESIQMRIELGRS